ncbi:MAG: hypothetical protein ACMUIP_07255 [bacterium]
MKRIKSIVTILVIMGILLHLTSFAAKSQLSGFADIKFVLSDGTAEDESGIEKKFTAIAELDYKRNLDNRMSIRIDLDFDTGGQGDSGQLEQAYFTWVSRGGLQFKGGVFNNHLGWEAEDAPDLYQITHGQLYDIWDAKTAQFTGNNVSGIAILGKVGQARVMGAFLNDLNGMDEENAMQVVVNFYPNKLLAAEVGMITQQETDAEPIIDGSLRYRKSKYLLGVELMQIQKEIDLAQSVTFNYKFNNKMDGTVRYDSVDNYEEEGAEEEKPRTSLTFAIRYKLHNNLTLKAEIREDTDENNDNEDGNIIRAEMVATF